MMMKFSTAVSSVVKEMMGDFNTQKSRLFKKVNGAFTWSNIKRVIFMPFRVAFKIGRFIGLTLRECFLNMMVDLLSGILPLIKWVMRIAVIALPIVYAVPSAYGMSDFVWPVLLGSAGLYMLISFLNKVFNVMLTSNMKPKYVVEVLAKDKENNKNKV